MLRLYENCPSMCCFRHFTAAQYVCHVTYACFHSSRAKGNTVLLQFSRLKAVTKLDRASITKALRSGGLGVHAQHSTMFTGAITVPCTQFQLKQSHGIRTDRRISHSLLRRDSILCLRSMSVLRPFSSTIEDCIFCTILASAGVLGKPN